VVHVQGHQAARGRIASQGPSIWNRIFLLIRN
jgi:hypothetical protein